MVWIGVVSLNSTDPAPPSPWLAFLLRFWILGDILAALEPDPLERLLAALALEVVLVLMKLALRPPLDRLLMLVWVPPRVAWRGDCIPRGLTVV